MKRVVVTGIGLLSSIGTGKDITWTNLLNGKSGIKKICNFDTEDFPCKIAGYISQNEDDSDYFDINSYLEPKEIKRNDRFIQYGIVAAREAFKHANIQVTDENARRIGVAVGSGIGGLGFIEQNLKVATQKGMNRMSPFFLPGTLVNMIAGYISIEHNLKGPNISMVTACATGTRRGACGASARPRAG